MNIKPKYHYRIVHDWLGKHYGKADKCESNDCSGKSATYEYCLKKGKRHERKRGNYSMLCRSCHRKYDLTDAEKKRLSDMVAGKFNENLKYGSLSRQRSVVLTSENKIFKSGRKLADYLGVNKSSIYMVLNGQRKTILGHKIKYAVN